MKMKKVFSICIALALGCFSLLLAGCGETTTDISFGAVDMLIQNQYTEITGDDAIAAIITHTEGNGYSIGEESEVSKNEIKAYKENQNLISASYFECDDRIWISVEQISVLRKNSQVKEYVEYVYEDFDFEEYKYDENEYGSKYFYGKYNYDGCDFQVIVTIKYGIACIVTVCNNEEQADYIADTIEITKDNIGTHVEGIKNVKYSVPDNFVNYEDEDFNYYECLIDGNYYAFELYGYRKDTFGNAPVDEVIETIKKGVVDVSNKEIIETNIGDAFLFVGKEGKRDSFFSSIEYDDNYYLLYFYNSKGKNSDNALDIFKDIIESLDDRENDITS